VICAAARMKRRRKDWRANNPSNRQKARAARDKARALGRTTYIGDKPCKKCGGRRRLVKNTLCAVCPPRGWRDLNAQQRARVLKRQRADKRRKRLALHVLRDILGVKIFEGDSP
jgi:hypothetical protein